MNIEKALKILELNINQINNLKDIKNAYRKKSLIVHPDKQNSCSKSFNELSQAYTFLSENIDSLIQNNSQNNLNNNKLVFVEEVESIDLSVDVTLSQVYKGTSIPITITRKIINNNIIKTETETIYINIIQGSDNNEIIIIENKGHIINNKKGNIKVILNLINDTDFIRKGLDLYFHKTISLKEALCGFTFNLTMLNNKTYNIKNYDTIIKPEIEKIIPDKGIIRNGITGNLFIKFHVTFPNYLNKEVIEYLKQNL